MLMSQVRLYPIDCINPRLEGWGKSGFLMDFVFSLEGTHVWSTFCSSGPLVPALQQKLVLLPSSLTLINDFIKAQT